MRGFIYERFFTTLRMNFTEVQHKTKQKLLKVIRDQYNLVPMPDLGRFGNIEITVGDLGTGLGPVKIVVFKGASLL